MYFKLAKVKLVLQSLDPAIVELKLHDPETMLSYFYICVMNKIHQSLFVCLFFFIYKAVDK